jgi:phage tail tube protein FII
MASTIYHMDAANLFVGDDDPTNSLYLSLMNVKLPTLEEVTKEHSGGGAIASIELGMRVMKALTMTFKLVGMDPKVHNRFMPASPIKYTMRGNMRDIREQKDIEVKAIIQGRMSKAEMSDFDKSKGVESDYEIKEVPFYQLFFGGDEQQYFDLYAGPAGLRIGGQPVFGTIAANLGLE